VVMLTINAMGLLRISPEGEQHGLDLHEHGISAYPEYVIASIGRPGGMASETPSGYGVAPLAASPKTS
jgi:ammonium transporter, Amt family